MITTFLSLLLSFASAMPTAKKPCGAALGSEVPATPALVKHLRKVYVSRDYDFYKRTNDYRNFVEVATADSERYLAAIRFDYLQQNKIFDRLKTMAESQPEFSAGPYTVRLKWDRNQENEIEIAYRHSSSGRTGKFTFYRIGLLAYLGVPLSENKTTFEKAQAYRELFAGLDLDSTPSDVWPSILAVASEGAKNLTISGKKIGTLDKLNASANQFHTLFILSLLSPSKLPQRLREVAINARERVGARNGRISAKWNDQDDGISITPPSAIDEGPLTIRRTSQALTLKIEVNAENSQLTIDGEVDRASLPDGMTERKFKLMLQPNGEFVVEGSAAHAVVGRIFFDVISMLREFSVDWT